MFKKTKVRSILELLGKNLSAGEVSKVLGVSRNTVAEVQALFLQSGKSRDDIPEWDDDRLYGLFYPDKFKYKPGYAPVDYSYVHKELKKTGVTEKLLREEYCARCRKDGSAPAMSCTEPDTGERVTAYLFVAAMPCSQMCCVEATAGMDEKAWLSCHVNMFRFFGGTPVKIVCDNLKTGVTAHPGRGEIILNEACLSLGGYYSVAIMPTGVRKPKQKAGVEGSVGKTATAVIAKLRNDSFTSLAGLTAGIPKAVKEFNDRPFQKRPGSRRSIFETEKNRT